MKLTGDLKKQVEKTASRQEKKAAIEQAGMLLTDDELDMVAGGEETRICSCEHPDFGLYDERRYCRICGGARGNSQSVSQFPGFIAGDQDMYMC